MQHRPDVCIAGAGIIGLSLALELKRLGASVCVLERDTPLAHASQAAAGMLATHDPENPAQLLPLSELSLALYPAFLRRIGELAGESIPFHTSLTFQSVQNPSTSIDLPCAMQSAGHIFAPLAEHSIDPRELAPALLAAVRTSSIRIHDHTALRAVTRNSAGLQVETTAGSLNPKQIVYTLGPRSFPPASPRKGQMLSVRIPASLALDYVVRTPQVYIVPRTHGPRAGQAIIGATVEDAGFSITTSQPDLASLRTLAARFLPMLADEAACPIVEAWAGLRPSTPDHLPILGHLPGDSSQFLATGHFRNGILLAPATAHLVAELIAGTKPKVSLDAFSPERFMPASSDPGRPPIFARPS